MDDVLSGFSDRFQSLFSCDRVCYCDAWILDIPSLSCVHDTFV